MRTRTVKALLLGTALLFASTVPAAAQATTGGSSLGVGLVFGSVGVGVDYSKDFRTVGTDNSLGWVVEGSYMHEGCGGFGFDCGVNWLLVGGGLRVHGAINDKLSWHGQGLIGFARTSFSGDFICDDDIPGFDFDCGDSSIVFTPGAGIDYLMSGNMSATGRIDVVTGLSGAGARIWLGLKWTN